MDINQLLDEAKKKLKIDSDYKLAKELGFLESEISFWRHGTRAPDAYACFKLAEIVGETPQKLIAQVQSKFARTEHKRLFFQRFFTILGLWITLGVILPNYTPFSKDVYAAGNRADIGITGHYTKWWKSQISNFMLIFERYFTCNRHVKFLRI